MLEPSAISILGTTPALLSSIVGGLPEAALTRPVDEGWSVRHVLAHVLDVEEVIATDRIARILAEDNPYIRSIDPLARINERSLLNRLSQALLDELASRRKQSIATLRGLAEEQLARAGEHDEAGPITVENLIHQWAYHDLMHVKQAVAILQAPLVEGMGNTRKFYDIQMVVPA